MILDRNTLMVIVVLMLAVIFVLVGVIIHLVNKLYATSIHLKDLVPLDLLIALRDGGVAAVKTITDHTPSTGDDFLPGLIEKVTEPFLAQSDGSAAG